MDEWHADSGESLYAGAACWLAILLFVGGCVVPKTTDERDSQTDARPPEWVERGEHSGYSADDYITGVGTGQTRRLAYTDALAEIVFQIQATIDVDYESAVRIEASAGDRGVRDGERRARVRQETRTERDLQLRSTVESTGVVELVDVWTHPENKVV